MHALGVTRGWNVFVLGSLWGRHLLGLTNLRLSLDWDGGWEEKEAGGGWDGVKVTTGCDNGDILGGRTSGSVELTGRVVR